MDLGFGSLEFQNKLYLSTYQPPFLLLLWIMHYFLEKKKGDWPFFPLLFFSAIYHIIPYRTISYRLSGI